MQAGKGATVDVQAGKTSVSLGGSTHICMVMVVHGAGLC